MPFKFSPLSLATWATFALACGASSAATITLDSSGRLSGATGVLVNSVLYDVQFRDGTCAALFNGCDSAADFTFTSDASARAASLALLAQVFDPNPLFDADASLTQGCAGATYYVYGSRQSRCEVLTPFKVMAQIGNPALQVANFIVANDSRDAFDAVPAPLVNIVLGQFTDTTGTSDNTARYSTWAVWSVAGAAPPVASGVPEPGSALLAGLGLMLAAAARRP